MFYAIKQGSTTIENCYLTLSDIKTIKLQINNKKDNTEVYIGRF